MVSACVLPKTNYLHLEIPRPQVESLSVSYKAIHNIHFLNTSVNLYWVTQSVIPLSKIEDNLEVHGRVFLQMWKHAVEVKRVEKVEK